MKPVIGSLVAALALALASPAAAEPTVAASEFARQHYETGLELARAGRYEEALREFLVAYEKSPHFAVLYNIGQAYIGLRQPVEALGALEQYLNEGTTAIPEERVERVNKQIAAQRAEVAELRILVNVAGAVIEVDGKPAGQSPMLEPLRVTAGTHLVSVTAPDRPPLLRSLAVGAGQSLDLAIELPAQRGVQAPGATPQPSSLVAAKASPMSASRGSSDSKTSSSSTLRTTGYVLAGAGVALGGFALGHYLWNRSRYEHWQREDAALAAAGEQGDPSGRQQANNELAASIERAEPVTVALALSAGAFTAAGATLIVMNLGGTSVQPTFAMQSGFRLGVQGAW